MADTFSLWIAPDAPSPHLVEIGPTQEDRDRAFEAIEKADREGRGWRVFWSDGIGGALASSERGWDGLTKARQLLGRREKGAEL